MDIGKEKTTIIIEPVEEPVVPAEQPRPAEPEKTPSEEPVPA